MRLIIFRSILNTVEISFTSWNRFTIQNITFECMNIIDNKFEEFIYYFPSNGFRMENKEEIISRYNSPASKIKIVQINPNREQLSNEGESTSKRGPSSPCIHLGSGYDKQLATHPPSISLRIDFKINGARSNCGGRTAFSWKTAEGHATSRFCPDEGNNGGESRFEQSNYPATPVVLIIISAARQWRRSKGSGPTDKLLIFPTMPPN